MIGFFSPKKVIPLFLAVIVAFLITSLSGTESHAQFSPSSWIVSDDGAFITAENDLYKVKFAYGGNAQGWFNGLGGRDGSIVELYYKPTDPSTSRNLVFRNGTYGSGYDALDAWEAESTGGTQSSFDSPDFKSMIHGSVLGVNKYELEGNLHVTFKIAFKAWEIDKQYTLTPSGKITISSDMRVVSPGTYHYLGHRFNFAGSMYTFSKSGSAITWGGNYQNDGDHFAAWTDGVDRYTGLISGASWIKDYVIAQDVDQNSIAHGSANRDTFVGFLVDSANENDPDIVVVNDAKTDQTSPFNTVSKRVGSNFYSYVETALYSHGWAPQNETQVGMTWFYMTSYRWNDPGYWNSSLPAWNETFHVYLVPHTTFTHTSIPHLSPTLTPTPTLTSTPTPTPTPPDVTSPTVRLTYPVNGQTHRRWTTLTMKADAYDNRGVEKVEFLVNGKIICTDTSKDYSCSWWMGGNVGDKYTITAKAYDEANNVSMHSVKITAIAYTPL